MVKKRGSNKMTYRPLKNSNMIGAGKKESVEQILKKGSIAKPPDKTHVEHLKSQQKPQKKTMTQITRENKAKLDKKPQTEKTVEKSKPKTPPTRGR